MQRAAAARDENAAGGLFLAGAHQPGNQHARVLALAHRVVHVPVLRDFDGAGGLVRVRIRVRIWVLVLVLVLVRVRVRFS